LAESKKAHSSALVRMRSQELVEDGLDLQGAAQAEHDGAAGDGVVNNHERPGGQSFEKHGECLRGAALPGAASSSFPSKENGTGDFLAAPAGHFNLKAFLRQGHHSAKLQHFWYIRTLYRRT